jgi:hypothetical protein
VKRRSLAIAVALCVLAPAAASAGRVGWNETAKVRGARVMSYRVDTVSVRKNGWSAHVSFKNLSHQTIRVGAEFGLAFYADGKATSLTQAVGFASATKFSTKTPTSLKPGESWTGVIGGSGNLTMSGRVYARVVFGPFTGMPGENSSVVWITDHATTVGTGAPPAPPVTGPVI